MGWMRPARKSKVSPEIEAMRREALKVARGMDAQFVAAALNDIVNYNGPLAFVHTDSKNTIDVDFREVKEPKQLTEGK